MVETEVTIQINRKSDFELVKNEIMNQNVHVPVYIFEHENNFQVKFTSDYEYWEFDSVMIDCFPGYEFLSNVENGRKEIRLQISRYQSEDSRDGFGRPIEDPLRETKYLVKKSSSKEICYIPNVKVLFGTQEENYFINIAYTTDKNTGEKDFLLLNEFKAVCDVNKTEQLKGRYKTLREAFQFGCYRMQSVVNEDFNEYVENKKKEIRKQQKLPRKIVRDFIKSCNENNHQEILKNLDQDVILQKKVEWNRVTYAEGIKAFEEYLNTSDQEFCNKSFKIRSSWMINLPKITIRVKYFPIENGEKSSREKCEALTFVFNNDKIAGILKED